MALDFICASATHAGLFFTREEEKEIGSWLYLYFCHTCWFVLYQRRGERDWLLTLSVLLLHMLVCSLPVKRRKRLALDFICASATHAGLVQDIADTHCHTQNLHC